MTRDAWRRPRSTRGLFPGPEPLRQNQVPVTESDYNAVEVEGRDGWQELKIFFHKDMHTFWVDHFTSSASGEQVEASRLRYDGVNKAKTATSITTVDGHAFLFVSADDTKERHVVVADWEVTTGDIDLGAETTRKGLARFPGLTALLGMELEHFFTRQHSEL